MKTPKILVALLAGGALVSCTQTQQKYGLGGAAASAAAGAYNPGGDYPVPPLAPVDNSNYKVATSTNRPGIVRSPYPPFTVVNVSALKTGDQARVPGSNLIFLVP